MGGADLPSPLCSCTLLFKHALCYFAFWHRETNETSQPSWEAVVNTGTDETVA